MKIHIMPAKGKKVRRPDTKEFLSENGELVEKSSFWVRRLQDQDVVLIQPQEVKEAKKQGDKQ